MSDMGTLLLVIIGLGILGCAFVARITIWSNKDEPKFTRHQRRFFK
jgi:hypothetical protein